MYWAKFKHFLALCGLGFIAAVLAAPACALDLALGSGEVMRFGDARSVMVADPEIAQIDVPLDQPENALVVQVRGLKTGTTTIFALDESGKTIRREKIVVRHNLAELQSSLQKRFPGVRVELESAPGSILVGGQVPDAETSEAILRTIKPYLGEKEELINRIGVNNPTQVYLRVRVTEMNKTVSQKLGLNWNVIGSPGNFVVGLVGGRQMASALGMGAGASIIGPSEGYSFLGGYSANNVSAMAMVDLLDQEGLVTVLAEPNLTAISGQTASFLAGGEYPIPVKQDKDTMSIEFKPFGVSLDFTPTVLADDRISLKVRPEISEIDPNASIIMEGLTIPGIRVRRVETTVEMSSGQSFAIGGLLQNNITDLVNQVPGLGNIPVLGKLFSSSDYRNNKSELVVIVTPILVRPTGPGQLTSPLSSMRASSDIEYVLQNSIDYDPLQSAVPRLSGAAGFVY